MQERKSLLNDLRIQNSQRVPGVWVWGGGVGCGGGGVGGGWCGVGGGGCNLVWGPGWAKKVGLCIGKTLVGTPGMVRVGGWELGGGGKGRSLPRRPVPRCSPSSRNHPMHRCNSQHRRIWASLKRESKTVKKGSLRGGKILNKKSDHYRGSNPKTELSVLDNPRG